MKFIKSYLKTSKKILDNLDIDELNKIIKLIHSVKKRKSRIFFIGVGGSAANCSHAVNDFRKLLNIECYTPVDNVSELTARINDDGWESVFLNWLKISKLNSSDMIFVLSVGGGNQRKKVSTNISKALFYGKKKGSKIVAILGRNDGDAFRLSNNKLVIPTIDKNLITPMSESFQSLLWHLIVSHPLLVPNKTKW
jgi:D-sedoheptulose 7-phosphate isomerase